MAKRNPIVAAVAAALLTCAGVSHAGNPTSPQTSSAGAGLSLQPAAVQPKYLADESVAPARAPLMNALHRAGVDKPLAEYGINLSGFIEGGYTHSFRNSPGGFLPGRAFDFREDTIFLNQLDLSIERKIDADLKARKFAVGGKLELMYGSDAGSVHSNGLIDGYPRERLAFNKHAAADNSPRNQFDVTQAYVTVGLPVGNGLTLTAGKFVTLVGAEYINPTQNALYSHSFLFSYAIPFTHTGVTAAYNLTDKLSVTAGFSRGWEQSIEDNNGAIDFIGQVGYKYSDTTNFLFNLVTGPERTHNDRDYRTLFDVVGAYTPGDKSPLRNWTFMANADFAWEQNVAPDGGGSLDEDAYWYGVAGYAGYKMTDYLTANGRLEWFRDEEGVRGIGARGNFYEATLGLSIHPFAKGKYNEYLGSLLVRPELRYDYAQRNVFGNGNKHEQFTVGVDAILAY